VHDRSYPVLLPIRDVRACWARQGLADVPAREQRVTGIVVFGLSEQDLELLDLYEGDDFVRDLVCVQPLSQKMPAHPDSRIRMDYVLRNPPQKEWTDSAEWRTLRTETFLYCDDPRQLRRYVSPAVE